MKISNLLLICPIITVFEKIKEKKRVNVGRF
jgi:hypothetical protein